MRRKMFSGADKLLFERAGYTKRTANLRTKPCGFKFRRQHPFSVYILDFYCHSLKLAIEVDGSIHEIEEVKQNDEVRQQQLEKEGLTFLRFSNDEIRLKPEEIIQQIETFLKGKLKTSNDS